MFRSLKAGLVEYYFRHSYVFESSASSATAEVSKIQKPNDEDEFSSKAAIIRSLLCKTPWWSLGHLRLGRLAIRNRDLDLALASLEAVRTLCADNKKKYSEYAGASIGISQCYLAKGATAEALEILERLPEKLQSEAKVLEQIAVCHSLLGNYKDAAASISKIPAEKRSAECAEMYEYFRSKAEN